CSLTLALHDALPICLWLALLAIRLNLGATGTEIESAGPEEEREQMLQIVRHVGSRNRYSLGWLGELLGLAGKSIPPGEIFGVAECSFDALSYLLSFHRVAVKARKSKR